MSSMGYFKVSDDYFWQYEEEGMVMAIPGGATIAYTSLVKELLDELAPQGLPPFGSLLLALVATNPNGGQSLNTVYAITARALNTTDDETLSGAIAFLKQLADVPAAYKTGKKRIWLLKAVFERCHNITGLKISEKYAAYAKTGGLERYARQPRLKFNRAVFFRDFRTLELLKNRLPDVQAIVNKMAGLPEVEEELLLPPADLPAEAAPPKDFIEELVAHHKTFYAGSLVKRIWSGLNIPVHSALPSQQPLGGVADLTNKGEFDKLLISEFANDDLVLMSRLANNEALYIRREIPPVHNNLERVILIDISLKNWGTPKTVAYAVMLAIARHPKTDIPCTAYVVGNKWHQVAIDHIDGIIEGMQLLEGSLHAAAGLTAFFKDFPVAANREVLLITEPGALKQPAMLKALNDHHGLISYWIHTDATGAIDIYKRQQNGKKHLQHLLLPLEELWQKRPKASLPEKRQDDTGGFPLLFRSSASLRQLLQAPDGEVFVITGNHALLRLYNKWVKWNVKGWELMRDDLPFTHGLFEMGQTADGEYLLLLYNPNKRQVTFLHINSGRKTTVFFNNNSGSSDLRFTFYEGNFYGASACKCWRISPGGNIDEYHKGFPEQHFAKQQQQRKELSEKHVYSQPVFKNIQDVYINQVSNLVFNMQELRLNKGYHIKLEQSKFTRKAVKAQRDGANAFVFAEGSRVTVHSSGMLILSSGDAGLPDIYMPSVLDSALAMAAGNDFSGNEYYYKDPAYSVILKNAGAAKLNVVKIVKDLSTIGLKEAKDLVDSLPPVSVANVNSQERAREIQQMLENAGAEAVVKTASANYRELNKISTSQFFFNYVTPFISHILDHGT